MGAFGSANYLRWTGFTSNRVVKTGNGLLKGVVIEGTLAAAATIYNSSVTIHIFKSAESGSKDMFDLRFASSLEIKLGNSADVVLLVWE